MHFEETVLVFGLIMFHVHFHFFIHCVVLIPLRFIVVPLDAISFYLIPFHLWYCILWQATPWKMKSLPLPLRLGALPLRALEGSPPEVPLSLLQKLGSIL